MGRVGKWHCPAIEVETGFHLQKNLPWQVVYIDRPLVLSQRLPRFFSFFYGRLTNSVGIFIFLITTWITLELVIQSDMSKYCFQYNYTVVDCQCNITITIVQSKFCRMLSLWMLSWWCKTRRDSGMKHKHLCNKGQCESMPLICF